MSTSDAEDGSTVREALRTVTPLSTERPNVQMNLFGYLIVIPIFLLLLPLLPFIAAGWLGSKTVALLRGE